MKTSPSALALVMLAGCSRAPASVIGDVDAGPGDRVATVDDTQKQDLRLMPAETYLRAYMDLFGALPEDIAALAASNVGDPGFGSWEDTLATLGLPDPSRDLPRVPRTNTVLLATFDKLGTALCDRVGAADFAEADLTKRKLFTFDMKDDSRAAFDAGFDVLHRRFLTYPAALAPADRADRYFALWSGVRARAVTGKSMDVRRQAGWITVCYGLVRHPEFQLY